MANWKKVIVSGSEAELDHIKISALSTNAAGSPLEFTAISGSVSTTPLVIDGSGNIFTGSSYAKESGGNTVGGSGLSQSVAIVGLNEGAIPSPGSQIQTASSAIPFNLNESDIQNANSIDTNTITSSNGYGLHTSSFASISGDTLLLGDSYKTVFTSSGIHLKSNITASVIPTTNTLPFYLGVSSSGELIKIDQSDVSTSGGSGGSIVKEGTNIDITGTAEDIQEYSLGFVNTKLNSVTQSVANNDHFLDNVIQDGSLVAGDSVRLKYSDGTTQDVTVTSTEITVEEQTTLRGLTFTADITSTPSAQLFQLITTPTVATVNLDDTIKLSNIELTGSLLFSGSSTLNGGDIHSIHPAGWGTADQQTLNISASSLVVDGNIDTTTLSFEGINFEAATSLVTTSSTVFGDASSDTHKFTGSVFFNDDLKFGGDTTDSTATFYAPIISGSVSIANTDIKTLSGTNTLRIATSGVPATEAGYGGSSDVNITLITSGSTFSKTDNGLGIAENGITSREIEDGAVIDAKLSDTTVTAGTYGSTTKIPEIVVDAKGRITGVSDKTISTGFTISDGSATDTFAGGETLTFTGEGGLTVGVTNNTITLTQNASNLSLTGTTTINDLNITTDLDVAGNIAIAGTTNLNGNVTIGDVSGDSHTINGNADFNQNVNIDGTLTVDGNTTLDNLIIDGNLTVNGTSTTLNTSQLHVEDRFILLGSGSGNASSNFDAGIIFEQGAQDGIGIALYHDDSDSRVNIAKSVPNTIGTNNVGSSGNGTIAGHVVTVRDLDISGTTLTTSTGTGNTNVQFGSGEMVIDNSNDIWIYTA